MLYDIIYSRTFYILLCVICICNLTVIGVMCYDSKLKSLSNELTLVLSDTRELDRVPSIK